ncbi:MAG: Nif3-like dinuclear metal center hexameric protein [Succinivibrionaceae bacterium]|nr:Nif3-like dinuclear metal center hexameric protein [Succinivibrionaceae bacterium]
MKRAELEKHLNDFLKIGEFRDYCSNGLQVEGKDEIATVVTGVSASRQFIEAAVEAGADAVIVHHGLFWKGDDPCVRGVLKARLAPLLKADVSLFAYHLPLDAHPELGNNVLLAQRLGIRQIGWCDGCETHPMVGLGEIPDETVEDFAARIDRLLGHRNSQIVGDRRRVARKVAWCTGSASEFMPLAAEHGADVFVTGEAPERAVHVAEELGIALVTAGHHCTETLGIEALGEHIGRQFATHVRFINIPNNF